MEDLSVYVMRQTHLGLFVPELTCARYGMDYNPVNTFVLYNVS